MKHVCLWNHEILGPIQKNGMGGPGDLAFKKLKILLDRMMLRRTKVGPLIVGAFDSVLTWSVDPKSRRPGTTPQDCGGQTRLL